MRTADFDYDLPQDRIAQTPIEPRDASRLMVYHRKTGRIAHQHFFDLPDFINEGDLLVLNRTKVIPARIFAKKATGGQIEILLLRQAEENLWETLVGGKRVTKDKILYFSDQLSAQVVEELSGARRLLRFTGPLNGFLSQNGQMPLPPYIHEKLENPARYQTVYAEQSGSAAAPTAGLHFTQPLIEKMKAKGIRFADVTLHVGLDTFAPVTEDDPETHQIHSEWCEIPLETAALIQETAESGRRVIAVGTTSARTLESGARFAASQGSASRVAPFSGQTDIFILPGYEFKAIDGIITNFHLPKSTLIMMISAFAGREKTLSLYQTAIEQNYRFFSFGDAMLID